MGDKNVISLLLIWDAIPFDLFFFPLKLRNIPCYRIYIDPLEL